MHTASGNIICLSTGELAKLTWVLYHNAFVSLIYHAKLITWLWRLQTTMLIPGPHSRTRDSLSQEMFTLFFSGACGYMGTGTSSLNGVLRNPVFTIDRIVPGILPKRGEYPPRVTGGHFYPLLGYSYPERPADGMLICHWLEQTFRTKDGHIYVLMH